MKVLNLIYPVVVVVLLGLALSCGSDNTVNTGGPENNSISGTITFTDTMMLSNDTINGYYNISAFANWPPTGPASANAKLFPQKTGNVYKASYKLTGLNNGNYVLTTAWIKLPYAPGSVYGLGAYGCDTSASCIFSPMIGKVGIVDNKGVDNINFLSRLDTAGKLYRF